MPCIGLTDIQKQLLKTKLGDDALAMAIIDMVDAGITSNESTTSLQLMLQ